MHWESKKINVTCFIVLFALLLQSGPELEISLTYACVHTHTHTQTHTHTHTHMCVHAQSLQLCLNICDPMDCSPPGSSVHGILQTRILKWVAMLSSRGSSQPNDQMSLMSPALAGRFFTTSTTWEAQHSWSVSQFSRSVVSNCL